MEFGGTGRDVFNEKPTKEELTGLSSLAVNCLRNWAWFQLLSLVEETKQLERSFYIRLWETFTSGSSLKSTLSLVVRFGVLSLARCPKTVENFTTHARNGYYDKVIFHRVIKGFMIQTGDPEGVAQLCNDELVNPFPRGRNGWNVDLGSRFRGRVCSRFASRSTVYCQYG